MAPGDLAPPWLARPGDADPLELCRELLEPGDLQARPGGREFSGLGKGLTSLCTDSVRRRGWGRPAAYMWFSMLTLIGDDRLVYMLVMLEPTRVSALTPPLPLVVPCRPPKSRNADSPGSVASARSSSNTASSPWV